MDGAFDRKTGNTVGNLTKLFLKSQMPRGLPGEGGRALYLTKQETAGESSRVIEDSRAFYQRRQIEPVRNGTRFPRKWRTRKLVFSSVA